MKLQLMQFDQPGGSFLLTVMSARDVVQISRPDFRKLDQITLEPNESIQREPSRIRIGLIRAYSETSDAVFPTPVILALDAGSYEVAADSQSIEITGNRIAEIVDGQHRVLGLKDSEKIDEFMLPVVLLLEPTQEQRGLIFATINGKQTKVPASLVYELFGLASGRSPAKTAHEIARALNSMTESPWYRRIKMLGRKSPDGEETLSQGTLVKFLLPQISRTPELDADALKNKRTPTSYPDLVFNEYWNSGHDEHILRILLNLFNGARDAMPQEWEDSGTYLLTKTTGYTGIMQALPAIVERGKRDKDLSRNYMTSVFERVKQAMDQEGKKLTKEYFPSSARGEAQFRHIIESAVSR